MVAGGVASVELGTWMDEATANYSNAPALVPDLAPPLQPAHLQPALATGRRMRA